MACVGVLSVSGVFAGGASEAAASLGVLVFVEDAPVLNSLTVDMTLVVFDRTEDWGAV